MESLVSGIKQLNGVLVVVMPDCLLYSSWQRPGQIWDPEVVGAYLGELVRDHTEGIEAIEGWSGVSQMTVELTEALIILRRIKDPFVIGYVFDRSTALGWARLQIQRTVSRIEGTLDSPGTSIAAPVSASVSVSAPAATTGSPPGKSAPPPPVTLAATPPPPPLARAVPSPPPEPEIEIIAAEPDIPEPDDEPPPLEPPPSVTASESPRDIPAKASQGTSPGEAGRRSAEASHSRASRDSTGKPTGTDSSYGALAPVDDEPQDDDAAASDGELPKGTRLIKYLDAHAPDTHAALLRVSLQTGLPLTLLRMPDSLSDDEFAQVEESVRRILGVDQLNF